MSFAVMGTKIGPLEIEDSDSIKTSFPNFKKELNKLGGKIF
jgi:5-enolpyruvylshikimate-3-phosphate synthase